MRHVPNPDWRSGRIQPLMADTPLAPLWVGTSGVVVPGAKATFPPAYQAGTRLSYYASLLNSVEINSTFYRLPQPQTFAKWATETGPDFRFTLKLWRGITHAKDLAFDPADIARFLHAADQLGGKTGALLIQFPPSITSRHHSRVQALLEHLFQADPANRWARAVEFRHASWYQDDTYDLLDEYQAALVLHDKPPGPRPAAQPRRTLHLPTLPRPRGRLPPELRA